MELTQFQNFGEQIFELFNKDCSSYHKAYTLRSASYLLTHHVDVFLNEANPKLKTPPKTVIELKAELRSDTIFREMRLFDIFQKEGLVNSWIVVYCDKKAYPDALIAQAESDSFKILQCDIFKALLEEADTGSLTNIVKVTWRQHRDRIILKAKQAIDNQQISLFLGAGVGQSANLPNWTQLLEKLFQDTNTPQLVQNEQEYNRLNETICHSSLIMGRYVVDGFDNYDKFKECLRQHLYENEQSSKLVDVIIDLILKKRKNVDSIITYNYDDLIESALTEHKIPHVSVYENNRCINMEIPIYHVHGFVPHDILINSKPILNEKDYHELYKETFHWSNVEQLHALNRNSCFFIGLSMTDPNIRRLLDTSRGDVKGDAPHFIFKLRTSSCEQTQAELYYSNFEQAMLDFGISTIWYETHDELPDLLKSIYQQVDNIEL